MAHNHKPLRRNSLFFVWMKERSYRFVVLFVNTFELPGINKSLWSDYTVQISPIENRRPTSIESTMPTENLKYISVLLSMATCLFNFCLCTTFSWVTLWRKVKNVAIFSSSLWTLDPLSAHPQEKNTNKADVCEERRGRASTFHLVLGKAIRPDIWQEKALGAALDRNVYIVGLHALHINLLTTE